MEDSPADRGGSKVDGVLDTKCRTVPRGSRAAQIELPLQYGEVSVRRNFSYAQSAQEGQQPAQKQDNTPSGTAVKYLRDLFADIESHTDKRYPALEIHLETAPIEIQRDFYRVVRSFFLPKPINVD